MEGANSRRRSLADLTALAIGLFIILWGLAHVVAPVGAPPAVSPNVPASAVSSPVASAKPSAASASLVDRAFTNEVVDVIRIMLVVACGFFAAALVQRTIVGDFSFKAGPVQLERLEQLKRTVKRGDKAATSELGQMIDRVDESIRADLGQTLETLAESLRRQLQQTQERLTEIERRIDS